MNILDVVFPKRCVGCGRPGAYFCPGCRSTIRLIDTSICPACGRPAVDGITHPKCRNRYSIDGLTSFFHYEGLIKKAVKELKYRFVSDLAKEFVSLVPKDSIPGAAVLVPIPLHQSRLRHRGFNQAEKLGGLLHMPMRTDMVRRARATKPQAEMKKGERLLNMRRAFIASGGEDDIALFDDVFTTGATMRAAAEALKRAGVKRVWGVTMAR